MSYWFLAVLLAWAAIVMFRKRQERQTPQTPGGTGEADIDRATLEAAEREVKDLGTDVRGRPLEDAVGDDWGPGTPKPPYV